MNKRIEGTTYFIHDDGSVFNEKTQKFVKPQSNGRYLKVTLSVGGKEKQYLVHRLVASAFVDNPFNKPDINHKNGIKTDNRASNLEWVTPSENQIHSVQTNLKKHGTDLWNGKFTKEQVIEIIVRKHKGESCRKLGKEFGCDPTTISAISRGLRYKQYFVNGELQHAFRLCGAEDYAHISEPVNPWHKASEDLPKENIHILVARKMDLDYAFDAVWYPEPFITDDMVYWMKIPEIKED